MAKDSIDKEVSPVQLEGTSAEVEQVIDSMAVLPNESKPSEDGEIVKSAEVEQVVDGVAELPDASRPSGRGEIIKSATLVMLGNLGSSVMGMLRQSFVASTGASLFGSFLWGTLARTEVQ